MARIQHSHCCGLASVSGRELKSCCELLQVGGPKIKAPCSIVLEGYLPACGQEDTVTGDKAM